MKRILPVVVLAIASIVLAQSPNQATLRTTSGDHAITTTRLGAQTMFAADEVLSALGGSVTAEGSGFKATVNGKVAAFGPDSRFAVIGEDLIEMPVAPMTVESRPFVPWQFFQGLLSKASDLDVSWDATTRVLTVKPSQQGVLTAQVSVANVQGVSKVVITLSGASEYTILKEPQAYTVHFKAPLQAPFASQTYEDPNVTKATFSGSDLRIDLAAQDIVADPYRLDNPFRVVLDLHKGTAPPPGALPSLVTPKAIEVPGIHTIVLDPGHGGKDVGATGPGGLMEKDATLAVCRKLADALETKLKTRVILTRNDDTVVPLDQRTAIANQYKADLFLSVHMNAAVVKGAHGSETYFLSLEASDELAKKAAEVENATAPKAASGTDLKLILWDLAQQEYLNESSKLASDIQEEMNRATNVPSRGVKQAPFRVLVGATMPAALVEVAFISNPDEEAKLKSDDFVNSVVTALTTAVQRYKTDYEARIGVAAPSPLTPAPAPTVTATTGTQKKAGQ
jgi:N-acetylmuramoyl-L-alanine amidase